MKRTQLSIKTSPVGGCKFLVYRSEDQASLPADLNALKALTPIMIVSEDDIEKTAESMEEVIEPDLRRVPMNDLIPYALSFDPLRNVIHYFEIIMEHVNANSGDVPEINTRVLTVTFNADGSILAVKYTTENGIQDLTGMDVIKFIETTVFIKETITNGAQYIKAKYFMKVISATDDSIIEDGITYNGPVATGLTIPMLSIQQVNQQITSNTTIPVLKLQPSKQGEGIVYYYRLVAKDMLGNLSDPSGLISSYVEQDASEVRFQIEVTDDSFIWKSVGTFDHMDVVEFGIPGTIMHSAFGSVIADDIRAFLPAEIIPETSRIISDNQVGITVPNPFSDTDPLFREREFKKFRSRMLDSYGKTSNWTESSNLPNIEVTVDKVLVIRKNVSALNEEDRDNPVAIDDTAAEVIKTWIRRYGRFYESLEHQTKPLNVRISDSPVVVFDDETSFPTLTAIDPNILIGEMYNYTLYIFDAFGDVSAPTSVVVTT